MTIDEYQKVAQGQLFLAIVNYNQELEISPVLERISNFFPKQHCAVFDDGSTDASPDLARKLGFHVIRRTQNKGVGASVRDAILFARRQGYKYFVVMSSNGKTRPEDLCSIVMPVLLNQADYVTGSRFIGGGSSPGLSVFRRISIPILSTMVWPILGRRFSDITCGYRCYVLSLFDFPQVNIEQEWLDRYEMEYYIHYWACKLGLRIIEVPVIIPYDHLSRGRVSKIPVISGWWSMLRPFVYLVLKIRK